MLEKVSFGSEPPSLCADCKRPIPTERRVLHKGRWYHPQCAPTDPPA